MVNITNKAELLTILQSLKKDTCATFGKMSAQHMIEHLILVVKISSNKIPEKNYYREEKAMAIKNAIIYSSQQMPVGFKSPILTDELPDLLYNNLAEALNVLMDELSYFNSYFKNNVGKTMCPTMGELNHEEWIIFHNKHFMHHFKQFNLI